MFDVSAFDAGLAKQEDGIEIEIAGPDGSPMGAKVRVASYESDRVKAAMRKAANAALLAQQKNPRKAQTVEDREAIALTMVVAAVLDWSGFTVGAKPLECTPENVRALCDKFPWFVEQIDKAASDRTLFFAN